MRIRRRYLYAAEAKGSIFSVPQCSRKHSEKSYRPDNLFGYTR
jgi:hypothetical protein